MAAIYVSIPSLLIITFPPLVMALISAGYALTAFYWFLKRRNQFAQHLQTSSSGINLNRYARLMALSVSQVMVELAIGIYFTSMYNLGANPLPLLNIRFLLYVSHHLPIQRHACLGQLGGRT